MQLVHHHSNNFCDCTSGCLLNALSVLVDLIGPENVELPILISLSWQMSAYAVKGEKLKGRFLAPQVC